MALAAGLVAAVFACGCDSQRASATPPAAVTTPQSATQSAAAPAARLASTHDLAADEALGGHTLQRHVGRSDAELRERLRREPEIGTASTYTDRQTAEVAVAAALDEGHGQLASWLQRRGQRPNLVLRYQNGKPLGRCLRRGRDEPIACTAARVVLRWDERRGRSYVLTSYPEPGR